MTIRDAENNGDIPCRLHCTNFLLKKDRMHNIRTHTRIYAIYVSFCLIGPTLYIIKNSGNADIRQERNLNFHAVYKIVPVISELKKR